MNYGYARVSTKGQAKDGNSLEAQEKSLRDSGAEIIYKETFTGNVMLRKIFHMVYIFTIPAQGPRIMTRLRFPYSKSVL